MPAHASELILSAFGEASGVPVHVMLDVTRLALGGVVLIWFAWAAARIGMQALRQQMTHRQATGYVLRAAGLASLVLIVLAA
jgi:RsiW-degrading membrane proteinase PrsW (M82 family)